MRLSIIMTIAASLFLGSSNTFGKSVLTKDSIANYSYLNHNHDLSLPDWGPYSKRYAGVSHISKKESGIRFDLSVFPGLYRRKVDVPNVLYESGFHPWCASSNLHFYTFRHEIEWKDKVYTDISYSYIDKDSRLITMDCVNNTDCPQNIVMHFMASINFPSVKGAEQKKVSYIIPDNITWIDAEKYASYKNKDVQYDDHLVFDGFMKNQVFDESYISSSGIKFNNGCTVKYRLDNLSDKQHNLVIRYSSKSGGKINLSGAVNKTIELSPSNGICLQKESVNITPNNGEVNISYSGKQELLLDGFAFLNDKEVSAFRIAEKSYNHHPKEFSGPVSKSIILKYDDIDSYYGIYWDYDDFVIRHFNYAELGDKFKEMINEHAYTTFNDGSNNSFLNIFMRPILVDKNSAERINGIVCRGSFQKEVSCKLDSLIKLNLNSIYDKSKQSLPKFDSYPQGKKYELSQQLMMATLSTNIVFPVFTQNMYIRHHTPGKWWNSLYTWDSGFIGIGLNQFDNKRALENLNTYVNDLDEQSAFIYHGSMVPMQMYLYQDIWNSTQSKETLRFFYPKLKRYYEFLMGRVEGSTLRDLNSGLLRTWDYFYNSGGWDDYPPQKACKSGKLFAPVVPTSHAIRAAKILQMSARILNIKKDIKEYSNDIDDLKDKLNRYSWDDKSGYFGYVEHDDNKNPIGIYKYKTGENYNMGLDGTSPFFADVCNNTQKEKIMSHLKSPEELWCPIGLSTVDRSAPYFKIDGYWNGAVWMPYQWIYWKAMLDAGDGNFAYKIANTALELWKKEADRTYNCFEHFIINSGNGAGWHQFGGLSSPVISWFKSYFQIGNITTGLNAFIKSKSFTDTHDGLSAKIMLNKTDSSNCVVIVCMNPSYDYSAYWNKKELKIEKIFDGVYNVYVPYSTKEGTLEVVKRKE